LSTLGAEQIIVHVKYAGVEQTFSGSVDSVWMSVNKFFSELIPAFDLARKVTLTIDLHRLVEDCTDVIAIAPEGPELLIPKEKLTDSETLQFYLLAAYVAHRLGKMGTNALTKEQLADKLGKNKKITTTRLGELVKQGKVLKTNEGNYKIATVAIKNLQEEIAAIKNEVW
jgi:hypothetical protein